MNSFTGIDEVTIRKKFQQAVANEVLPHFHDLLRHPLIRPSVPRHILKKLEDDDCRQGILALMAVWISVEAKRLYLVLRQGERPMKEQVSVARRLLSSTS